MPLLIYVTLQANPEHIVSNVQYILRFRNQDKLGGEAGYYLSSLVSLDFSSQKLRLVDSVADGGYPIHREHGPHYTHYNR